jgi:hypothetical protein
VSLHARSSCTRPQLADEPLPNATKLIVGLPVPWQIEMQLGTADIDQVTWGREFLVIIPCGDCLEDEPDACWGHEVGRCDRDQHSDTRFPPRPKDS